LKTVDAGLVTIAPAKVQSVAPNNAQVANLDIFGNGLRFQGALTCPFINALSARTSLSQGYRSEIAYAAVGPGNPELAIALL
jgi:hypothetical protein